MKKSKYYLSLDAAERRLAVHAMLHFRNKVLARGVDTVDIDRVIGKLQGRKAWWK